MRSCTCHEHLCEENVFVLQIPDESLGLLRHRVVSLNIVRGLHAAATLSLSGGVGGGLHEEEDGSQEDLFDLEAEEDLATPSVGDIKVQRRANNRCRCDPSKRMWEAFASWEDQSDNLKGIPCYDVLLRTILRQRCSNATTRKRLGSKMPPPLCLVTWFIYKSHDCQ